MSDKPTKESGFGSRAIHLGEPRECSSMPIYQVAWSQDGYARTQTPTTRALEQRMASLEGGGDAIATACGMASVSQTLFALLSAGDRVVSHHTVYPATADLLTKTMPRLNVQAELINFCDLDAVRSAVKKETRLVYFEPLANPSLEVIDVQAVVEIAHDVGATVVVDNTFLTPYLLRPLELGADVVLHSATKYLCGHGDTLAGIVTVRDDDLLRRITSQRCQHGGIISPLNTFLILRGLKTLHVRMDRHCENARRVAEFLQTHPKVRSVRYPGQPSDPGHTTASKQWANFGGMVGMEVADADSAERFGRALQMCRYAGSLGDAGTIAAWYVKDYSGPERDIPPGYIRLSIGLENVEDIISDLDQALLQ